MKSDRELVELAIEHFDLFELHRCWGLCAYTDVILYGKNKISFEEKHRLLAIIYTYRPEGEYLYYYTLRDAAPRLELLKTILKDIIEGE